MIFYNFQCHILFYIIGSLTIMNPHFSTTNAVFSGNEKKERRYSEIEPV